METISTTAKVDRKL